MIYLLRCVAGRNVPLLQQMRSYSSSCCRNSSAALRKEIQDANERYAGRIAICKVNDDVGWGLKVMKDFRRGDVVIQAKALETLPKPHSHTVQIDFNRHVMMDLPARFVNHRCNSANLGVQDNDLGAFDFIALRDISQNEELTWDYEDAEYDMDTPFECACGDVNCRKLVRGWKYSNDSGDHVKYLPKYRQDDLEEKAS